jgi:hypothetical protein
MRHARHARWIVAAWLIASSINGDALASVGGEGGDAQAEAVASPREIFSAFQGKTNEVQVFNGAGRLVTISLGDASQNQWANSTFGSLQSRVFVVPDSGAVLRIVMRTATTMAQAAGNPPPIKTVKYRLAPRSRYQIVSTSAGELALMLHVTKDTALPATEVP